MNNTNRAHDFVDMVAKISADKGVPFDFANSQKLKESGFAIDGKIINGYVSKDGVTVNIDSAKALNSVVGHEITHILEGTELYTELSKAITEYAKSKGDYQGRYDAISKLYEGVEGANVDAELTADLVGDYLFTNKDFIMNLSTEHRGVFKKILDELKYLLNVATKGSKEARELEKVKKAFEDAYRETGKTANETKYLINKQFYDDYDAWDKKDPRKIFTIGNTSDVLTKLGVKDSKITWDASKIIKIKSKHSEMTDNIIKQVPDILERPIAVFQSLQNNSRLTIFGEVYANDKPVLAVLELNPTGRNGTSLDEIKIASAYGKDNAQNFINRSETLYVENDKKRVSEWEIRTGLQLPVGISSANSTDSISQNNLNVNTKFSLSEKVEKHFGTTYNVNEAGYLLTDGKMLDFSGKHNGASGGYRTVDHRDIAEAFDWEYGDGSYSGGMVQFMQDGNIRLVPEIGGINLSVKPNKNQISALDRYISKFKGEIVLDIDDAKGNTVASAEYPKGTYSKKIIADIINYFDNGVEPQTSSLAHFLSMSENGEGLTKQGAWNIRGKDVRLEKAPTQEDIAPVAEATEAVIRNLSVAVTSATTTYGAIRNNKLNTTRQSSSFTPGLFLFVFECELVSTCTSGHARWPRSADKP